MDSNPTATDEPVGCTYCETELELVNDNDARRAFACHLEATPACLARAVTDLARATSLSRGQARGRILADAVGERVLADALKSQPWPGSPNRAARRAAARRG